MDTAVRQRVTLLLIAVLLAAGGICARLAFLQVFRCEALRARASGQHWKEFEIPATRGSILDRTGQELALSLKTEELCAHPPRVEDAARAAEILAPLIDRTEREIREILGQDKPFVYLDRFLDPDRAAAVRASELPIGNDKPFFFLPSSKRYYPRGRLAVHVLGFANVDGLGVEGIEQRFDYELAGDPTTYLVLQDGLKGHVREKTIGAPAKRPWDVVLSIDTLLQHVVERELDRAMRETHARAASAIVMDSATGQILALANRPSANPNEYGRATDAERLNRAVVHQYEPGSTFKIIAMAAALQHTGLTANDLVDCENGSFLYHRRFVRDISRNGILTAREVFEKSSNVGMVKIVDRVRPDDLHATIASFGFGRPTGLELPGESAGMLRPVHDWSGQSRGSLAFGYEVGVTVVQMASALATVANGGVRVPPRLALGLRDSDGVVRRFAASKTHRALDAETARELTALMEGVVLRGTGTRARIAGYRLAGKSGTTKKLVRGEYSDTHYIASFGGFAPVTSPRLVALVTIDTPQGEHYGGQVAAPVFQRIMEDALAHVRAPRDDETWTLAAGRSGDRGTVR